MKRIDGYQCENCQAIHNTAQAAMDCEKSHNDRREGAKIQGMSFKNPERDYGMGLHMSKMYPQSVMIKFSDGHGDFARYVLDHVGYRGL